MSTTAERFAALFAGRTNAFGLEAGGCQRVGHDWGDDPWDRIWSAHLTGERPIGVYPMVQSDAPYGDGHLDWFVKWGCVDLDVKTANKSRYDYESADDALDAARNLVAALRHFGIVGEIERTKSGGFHVWVFCANWVPAATMRRALLVACAVADVPPTEVNPKAEGSDDPEFLGNYVRLPYPGALTNNADPARRRVLNERGDAYALEVFLDIAEASLTDETTLSSMADLYVVPRTESRVEITGEVELDESLRRRLSGLTWTVLRDGPLEGQDRSSTLFRLAHLCREDELTPDEAFAVVSAGDAVWGKFSRRRDADRYIREIVERAYA